MTSQAAARAAALLIEARRTGSRIATLPDECRPMTLVEGYQVQDAFVSLSGQSVAGFKIGATSQRAQEFLGSDTPFAGCVLAANILRSPAEVPAAGFPFRLIEPEFAFTMAQDLPARGTAYEPDEVAGAAASVHPAIEVVTSGLENWQHQGVASLVADNGVDGALILGEACTAWRGYALPDQEVTLTVNGELAGRGRGANAMGGPITALTWLVNDRRIRGLGLEAGQVVTTGVVTEFVELDAGDEAIVDFGPLGSVQLRCTA